VLRVRQNQRPAALYTVPEGQPLEWHFANGVVTVRIPQVRVHDIVVVESARTS